MELYLVNNKMSGFHSVEPPKKGLTSYWFQVRVEPVEQECEASESVCKTVAYRANGKLNSNDCFKVNDPAEIGLFISKKENKPSHVKVRAALDSKKCHVIYDVLSSMFGPENISFCLTIEDFNVSWSCGCVTSLNMKWRGKRMEFSSDRLFLGHDIHPAAYAERRDFVLCRLTLTVKIETFGLDMFDFYFHVETPVKKLGRLLDEGIGGDVIITVDNGNELKCHKCILMLCSQFFRALFDGEMIGSPDYRIDMSDMTESGVKSLIRFMYLCDLQAAIDSCDVTCELYMAADKYGIMSLGNQISSIICKQPEAWFTVGAAIRIWLYAHRLDDKTIVKKMIGVIKLKAKTSVSKLLASYEYENLFRNDRYFVMSAVADFMMYS